MSKPGAAEGAGESRGVRGRHEQPSVGECGVNREVERQGSREAARGESRVNESADVLSIRDAIHPKG
jgi:hypothetical protein